MLRLLLLEDWIKNTPVMPRPVTFLHVLRTARELHGISQKELARRIGIAPITLNKYENGQARISEGMATLFAVNLWVDYNQILTNDDPLNPRMQHSEDLLSEFFETGKGRPVTLRVEKEVSELVILIKQLFRVARKKEKLLWVSTSIRNSLDQIKAELEGGSALKQLTAKKGRPPKSDKSARKPKRQPL
jgi:transcriptional regulator with XRE-family HTH domain